MVADRVFQPVTPFGSVGPVFRSLACPRCGTTLALVGLTTTAGYFDAVLDLRRHVQALLPELRRHQTSAPLAAYLLIRDGPVAAEGHLREVWPAEPSRAVTPSEWATVRPALQQRHQCVRLTTVATS